MNMSNPSVSVITVTCPNRVPFHSILIENMKGQTYGNITQWIIVYDMKNKNDASIDEIENARHYFEFPIKILISSEKDSKIGRLRNMGNDSSSGDVIVWMDDDDYYPPEYIEHAVECLKPPYRVAGCSELYVYDMRWDLLVQSKPREKNHTTNNCLAYYRGYLLNHRYDESVSFDEESSFLEMPHNSMKASIPIAQMDPRKSPLHMIHRTNTADKGRAVLSAIYDQPYCCMLTKEHIDNLIPSKTLQSYKKCLGTIEVCDFDIVYVCGMWSIQWDPTSESLGGSEQAVINLSREWVTLGLKVAVYGEVTEKIVGNVHYYPFAMFNPYQKFKTLILWRYFGMVPFVSCGYIVNTDHLLLDLHDNIPDVYENVDKILKLYPNARVCFKSRYHEDEYMRMKQYSNILKTHQKAIIWNGIQTEKFLNPKILPNSGRNQFRICYTSCYTRGLLHILRHFWPLVKMLEPRAELHLYYGMEYVIPEEARLIRDQISKSAGVCDHGRQSIHMIAREKHMSGFHLYVTETIYEIDCISIRESLVAGCIPIILDMNVFRERDGFHIPVGTTLPDSAKMFVDLMRDQLRCSELRNKFSKSPTIATWKEVAQEWLELMK